MNEKKFCKIAIIKDNDIIGLDDYVVNNKYVFTVELCSTKGEVFEIKSEVI